MRIQFQLKLYAFTKGENLKEERSIKCTYDLASDGDGEKCLSWMKCGGVRL